MAGTSKRDGLFVSSLLLFSNSGKRKLTQSRDPEDTSESEQALPETNGLKGLPLVGSEVCEEVEEKAKEGRHT